MPLFNLLSTLVLPKAFPLGVPSPKFVLGAWVAWKPLPNQDFGVITGMEYAPFPDLDGWGWRYTVWLDVRSTSAQWIPFDLAWEDDLIPFPANAPGKTEEMPQA